VAKRFIKRFLVRGLCCKLFAVFL